MEDQFSTAGRRIDVFRQTLKADVSGVKLGESFDEVPEGAAQPIQAPDDEDIPFPEEIQRILQAFALVFCPADRIGEDFDAAGSFERVLLKVEVLILGRNTGIPDEWHSPIVSKLIKECNIGMMICRCNL